MSLASSVQPLTVVLETHDSLQGISSVSNTSILGGAGTDSIRIVSNQNITVLGGDSADTIRFEDITAAGNIDGGAGADSIAATAASNFVGSLKGGDADTIELLGLSAATTIMGGAGNDSIVIRNGDETGVANNSISGGAGTDTVSFLAASGVSAARSAMFNIDVDSNDVNSLGTAFAITDSATNWFGGQVFVGSTMASASATGTTNGNAGVFVNGTTTYFMVNLGAQDSVFTFVVTGNDLVSTSITAANVAFNSTNFDFTLASTNSGLTVTLS